MNVALPRLPPEVQRQGVIVKKVSSAFLMAISLISHRQPLRLAVPHQLRADQPGEPDRQPRRAWANRGWARAGLLDARLGEPGQDGEVSGSPPPMSATPFRRRTGRIRRVRSGSRRRRNGTDFQYSMMRPGPAGGSVAVRGHRRCARSPMPSLLRVRDVARVRTGRADL